MNFSVINCVGEVFVPTSANERKSFTKVFGPTTPQKHYLIKGKDSTLCLSENTYLHRDPSHTNDRRTKLNNKAHEKFENKSLSSYVDNEMRRMRESKFLNTKLPSIDGGKVRKCKCDDGSLVENRRKKMLGKEGLEKDRSLCEVRGVILKNNKEKIGKYSRRYKEALPL